MSVLFTAAEQAFRAEIRAFVRAHLPDDIRDKLCNGRHPSRADTSRWTKILAQHGYGGYPWPKEFGGAGFTPVERYIFEDECAAYGAPEIIPWGVKMVGQVLIAFGSEAQKGRYLAPMARLDEFWCQGYSEPGAGSDLAVLKTKAQREGDFYRVNGQKVWTTEAHNADWIFCLVRTSDEDKPQKGISFLLIKLDSPGITIRPIITMDGRREINEVWFDDVMVPADQLVGTEGQGWSYAKYLLEHERLNFGGMGFCKRELARLKARARAQTRFGKPLIEDSAFALRLAAIEAELQAIDLTNLRFLREVSAGQQNALQAPMLKIISSEMQALLAEMQLRAAGAEGLRYGPRDEDAPSDHAFIAENYANMRKVTIYAGTNEIQRNIAAKGILG